VATINGQPIFYSELDLAIRKLPPPPPNLKEPQLKALHRNILMMMIDEVLVKQMLSRMYPQVDPIAVQQRRAELEASLKTKGKTIADLVREMNYTEAKLSEELVVRERARLWHEALSKQVSDDALRKYHDFHREMFDGAVIRVSHIVVKAEKDQAARQAAWQRIHQAKQELIQGTPFADVARKYSQDPTAQQGGDMGYFPPRSHDPDPFIRTASSLKRGQTSDVVQTEYGFHLIQITDRKDGTPTTLEKLKDTVRDVYVDEMKAGMVAEYRKNSKIEVNLP
jgi:peptidyl-prolyl cis-trans isomerase C